MTSSFPKATIVGYPRIGRNRELKKLEESYWSGKISKDEFLSGAKELRLATYQHLQELGLTEDYSIPASFSYYDQVLDAAVMLGAVPERFEGLRISSANDYSTGARPEGSFGEIMRRPFGKVEDDEFDIDAYFTIARGDKTKGEDGLPGEMTKWFDTNYHYIVPELGKSTRIGVANAEVIRQFVEAKEAGFTVRPQIVGPATFLALAKYDGVQYQHFLEFITAAYARILGALATAGAQWVQFDEPALVSQTHGFSTGDLQAVLNAVYGELAKLSVSGQERPQILITTPFGNVDSVLLKTLEGLPVEAVHFDLVTATPSCHSEIASGDYNFAGKTVVAGVVNGRNIWRTDLTGAKARRAQVSNLGADTVSTATSCSLQHTPHTLADEKKLAAQFPELLTNLSFADEKIAEVVALAGGGSIDRLPQAELDGRKITAVQERVAAVTATDLERESIAERKEAQAARLNLPLLPTTTIGSFPQTTDIRVARANFKKGVISEDEYKQAMRDEIKQCVQLQEDLGLDVLVHGEAERNDMVQYFAENFEGFDVTENGWVQSYGSRCTKPSVLWGDVYRKEAFTVEWISYAQTLTDKFMKGMLTGPVTIMAWSFVRDDQPKKDTAYQVGLALKDEIADLEAAGIAIIQVDEPALRELLPLKKAEQAAYLDWSVSSFRLATSGVKVDTQIHTHLCYSEFEVVLPAIIGLNADVTSIEAARSKMEIVQQLVEAKYPLGVGPGVYDIHSPRIPSEAEITGLLEFAVDEFKKGSMPLTDLWVNPDCGLKTRKDEESTPSLKNMVQATLTVRKTL
ncbi:5-methyltetrahydropteroyltriglutamate--homocysteine methyltransferase [Actinomycetota bacterium]|nr:5-methyltetrahydropteroyltriglutamate--homocysteine methyltransferase [Actinomycetota bacterium]